LAVVPGGEHVNVDRVAPADDAIGKLADVFFVDWNTSDNQSINQQRSTTNNIYKTKRKKYHLPSLRLIKSLEFLTASTLLYTLSRSSAIFSASLRMFSTSISARSSFSVRYCFDLYGLSSSPSLGNTTSPALSIVRRRKSTRMLFKRFNARPYLPVTARVSKSHNDVGRFTLRRTIANDSVYHDVPTDYNVILQSMVANVREFRLRPARSMRAQHNNAASSMVTEWTCRTRSYNSPATSFIDTSKNGRHLLSVGRLVHCYWPAYLGSYYGRLSVTRTLITPHTIDFSFGSLLSVRLIVWQC